MSCPTVILGDSYTFLSSNQTLVAQPTSCLLIRRHWLLLSATFVASSMAWRRLWPLIPRSLSNLVLTVAMNPPHPTSSRWTSVFQPRRCASTANSAELSQGGVCAMMKIYFRGGNQRTMPSLSGGKTNRF